jgi:ABC-2 type transport system ATP-binding protein
MTDVLPTRLEAPDNGVFGIETRDLVKRFGADVALDRVTLQVPEGAVYVLVGPNGAGKSTIFRMLLDLARPDGGHASLLGADPRVRGAALRATTGYVPEHHTWGHPWMSVGAMLAHHATYFRTWDTEYAAQLARGFGLRSDRRVGALSKGQGRRVHLVMALAHRPRILLLDEPTDGLDPVMLDETLALLADHLASSPTTVLLSTHQVGDVDRLVDHVGVMRHGRLILQATRDVLHRSLRRYRAEVPAWWQGVPALDGSVLRRARLGREIQWSVWGEERAVVERLSDSGAVVRDVAPLTLNDAALTLLSSKSEP